ncbi:MAG: alanyl-tRNA editing protein [Clostridia bacterium]|nr:alanyl-tRNA editing protein [Clostridia bacterium]
MTKRIFDEDAYRREFTATVLACKQTEGGFFVTLDATAFFPEEGGQYADTGTLGDAHVIDVQERDGVILHRTDAALAVGRTVEGRLDFAARFDRMQNHSGEHIVSGIVFRRYGFHNVGFHLNDEDMTMDFDGVLTREQLDEIEDEANRAIFENLPVTAYYPAEETLATLPFRAKDGLSGRVRLVQIGDVDLCACCAPHVASTGEIGLIKLLDFIHYKGGVRIHAACGMRALVDYRTKCREITAVSRLLSVPQNECAEGTRRLQTELGERKMAAAAYLRALTEAEIGALAENQAGNLVYFSAETDANALRRAALIGASRVQGVCAVLYGKEGDFRAMIASAHLPLKERLAYFREGLSLRGGGNDELIQGSVPMPRAEIEAFFAQPIVD